MQLANVTLVQQAWTPVTAPNVISASLSQAEEHEIYKQKRLEQEERLAQELSRINHEKCKDEKMRQYIKENR